MKGGFTMTKVKTEVKEIKEVKNTKGTMNAPKQPKTKVTKEVAKELEQTIDNDLQEEIKENEIKNEMESVNMENIKEVVKEEMINEQVEQVEEVEQEDLQDSEVVENENGILHRDEFAKLTFAEQVKLMKQYRKEYPIEQIKREMGHSTSSYYALMKRLGLHSEIARPLSQPRGSQKTQTKAQTNVKTITHSFTSNGVAFEGDLNIESLLEQIQGFINLGGGEQNFEFNLELIRK